MPRFPIVLLLALLLPTVGSTAIVPLTDEVELVRVTDAETSLSAPTVASRGNGYVVAWTSTFARYPAGSQLADWGGAVRARRVGADGRRQGPLLNLVPERHKIDLTPAALASDASGRFAVVWSSSPEFHPYTDVNLRQFEPSGAVASTVRLDRLVPPIDPWQTVALGTGGRAFAVWQGLQPGRPDRRPLFGQIVLPGGQTVLPRVRLTDRGFSQGGPQIDTDRQGNAVVVYQNTEGEESALFLRRYDRTGRALTGEVRVTPSVLQQAPPVLDVNPDGRFAIAWVSEGRVWARLYGPPNRALGPAFPVSEQVRLSFSPDVAVGRDGTVFVVWQRVNVDTGVNVPEVWGRTFDSAGRALGEEFRVDPERVPPVELLNGTGQPSVAASEGNTFLVAWQSITEEGETFYNATIFSRLYGPGPAAR